MARPLWYVFAPSHGYWAGKYRQSWTADFSQARRFEQRWRARETSEWAHLRGVADAVVHKALRVSRAEMSKPFKPAKVRRPRRPFWVIVDGGKFWTDEIDHPRGWWSPSAKDAKRYSTRKEAREDVATLAECWGLHTAKVRRVKRRERSRRPTFWRLWSCCRGYWTGLVDGGVELWSWEAKDAFAFGKLLDARQNLKRLKANLWAAEVMAVMRVKPFASRRSARR